MMMKNTTEVYVPISEVRSVMANYIAQSTGYGVDPRLVRLGNDGAKAVVREEEKSYA